MSCPAATQPGNGAIVALQHCQVKLNFFNQIKQD